ncbi:NACHT domain-containing protein [Nostoc sp.]|uniref:NACHT domain-containing protein n=1 Tax=Nostoc sp. TaxID=1180 RepID=UPI002FFB451B
MGKPGAGKTTFLKYLAIQCIGGEFQAERVPIFVTLKNFAEIANKPELLQYIREDAINPISSIQDVITYGKALVLLDGLDEVREEHSDRVLKEIREFSDRFPKNQFVMTCRIAAKEYIFDKFTDVEVADFDDDQIFNFTNNWFKDKAVKPETFIKRLKENNRIKELAASPLLLTLLCLAFEESGDFPANRSELYKEGLDALLKKWDAKRGIKRDQIYKKLSVQRKEDLLSKMALTTFEGSEYFFKQKVAEQYITEYIRNLPGANTDEEALQVDSEQVLRSIEHHHGLVVARAKEIYSFSHLTFHEYFTAREFVVVRQSSEEALQNLVSHITEKRWREVLLLAVGMSSSADYLLQFLKKQVDAIIADDNKLQQFLMWIGAKSTFVQVNYTPAVVRSFYFFCSTCDSLPLYVDIFNASFNIDFNSTINMVQGAIEQNVENLVTVITHEIDLFTENDLIFDCVLDYLLSVNLKQIDFRKTVYTVACFLSRIRGLERDCALQRLLQELQEQIPDLDRDKKNLINGVNLTVKPGLTN